MRQPSLDALIAKEGLPALVLVLVRVSLREIPRDGGEADGDPKFLEFSSDLSGAPAVLSCESTNEGLHFNRDGRPPGTALRNGSPVQLETLAMPTDDGVRLDDDEGLLPPRPDLRQKDPEYPID